MPSSARASSEVASEQHHLDELYELLDLRRAGAGHELDLALKQPRSAYAAGVERAATVERLRRLIRGYGAAEHGLCFGRLDLTSGERRYLGRIGLRGDDPAADPLLVDWRSEAARAFYTATAASPQGVRVRRHLHTRGRDVVRVDDELLDGEASADDLGLVGEAALLAALRADRTGRMSGAVATLQAEQDRIIRSAHQGVLVVQGGPGTGKTVVALHRAAYLLYSHPTLDRRGVLVVGPNPLFLSYIEDVLPGLGETSVVLTAVGDLFPGVRASAAEPEAVTAVKGRLEMAGVVAAAVRARQAEVTGDTVIDAGGESITLPASVVTRAAERARAAQARHNRARLVFVQEIIGELARRLADEADELQARFEAEVLGDRDLAALDRAVENDLASVFGTDDLGEGSEHAEAVRRGERDQAIAHWRRELAADRSVLRAISALWPRLTPERLLADLFGDPPRWAPGVLADEELELLRRDDPSAWTPADVPLLDEAAELLGEDRRAQDARAAREQAAALAYAQGVLDIAVGSRAQEHEDRENAAGLSATDLVDAAALAGRHDDTDLRSIAERAAADRTWTYGHVIVDEAQELSPMAWRLLLRRCPSGSFTVVGDLAQSGQVAGPSTWAQTLTPFFEDRWRLERLTINYRTPSEIMGAADRVLAGAGAGDLEPARAIRSGAEVPVREQVRPGELPARLADLARRESAAQADGRVAVLVPEGLVRTVTDLLGQEHDADLESPVVVLPARQAKGLEFDSVVVGDPEGIIGASARGLNDLYVALTRATRRLHVVHPGPVPELLAHLPAV